MKYIGLVEVMIESDRGREKSAGQTQTIRRVSEWVNYQWVE